MRNLSPTALALLLAAGCYEPGDFPIEGEEACGVDGWTCPCSYYGTGDGCDTSCGAPDPDCGGVPGCPAGWTCPCSYYGTSDGCDTSCGLPDPDCGGGTATCEQLCTHLFDDCGFPESVEVNRENCWQQCELGYFGDESRVTCFANAACTTEAFQACQGDRASCDRMCEHTYVECGRYFFTDAGNMTQADCVRSCNEGGFGETVDCYAAAECSDAGFAQCGRVWTCDQALFADGVCDCECGASDPDCGGAGCAEPGCQAPACQRCWADGAAGCDEPTCQPVPYAGHDYTFCPTARAWLDAQAYCQEQGALLATIADPGENEFVAATARSYFSQNYWIGGRGAFQSGPITWVGGEPSPYTNWAPGEPNNSGGSEFCLEVWLPDGTWNDLGCEQTRPFVCEW